MVSKDAVWTNKLPLVLDSLGQGSSSWHPQAKRASGIIDRVLPAKCLLFSFPLPATVPMNHRFHNYWTEKSVCGGCDWVYQKRLKVKRSGRYLTSRYRLGSDSICIFKYGAVILLLSYILGEAMEWDQICSDIRNCIWIPFTMRGLFQYLKGIKYIIDYSKNSSSDSNIKMR